MNERIDWGAIFIFAVAILGMIGTFWLRYYIDERSKIGVPVSEPIDLVRDCNKPDFYNRNKDLCAEPIKSWPVEEGKDKG
jgi:hypothetical protein